MKEKPTFTGEPRRSTERDPDLCVITCALDGVLANRKQSPGIPYTPEEIAEEARRAYDAGQKSGDRAVLYAAAPGLTATALEGEWL